MPLVLTILTREAGPKRLGRVLAILGVLMLLGPVFGPVLGGWLIDSYGWEWIFWINLPIGLIAFVLAAVVFPPDHSTPSETFDLLGMLLLSPAWRPSCTRCRSSPAAARRLIATCGSRPSSGWC